MKNETINLREHPVSRKDAFWYWIVGKLGDVQAFIIEHKIQEPVWRSFDGRVNTPKTMSDKHLHNTITMIERAVGEGEQLPPQYPALVIEYERRRERASEEASRFHAAFLAEVDANKTAREAQMTIIPSDYAPEGWFVSHRTDDSRAYRTESGARVSLNRDGTWSWWRPHLHHITCYEHKTTLEEALKAALS